MGGSDATLLRRWAGQRDAEAFAELVRRHSGMVYGTCLRVLHNAADAEDAAQESFLSLVRLAQGEERLPASLGGWLHAVAVRRALDCLRSESRRRARETRSADSSAVSPEPDCDDITARVDEAIAGLAEELRYPLVRHFLEGASHREVARELGLARRTVTSRIARGVETVREQLGRQGVVVSAAALTSALAAESAHAVPAALAATLGRLAVAGATGGPPAIPGALIGMGGLLMTAKKVAVLAAGVALVFAGWVARDGISRQLRAVVGTEASRSTAPPARVSGSKALRPGTSAKVVTSASPSAARPSPVADGSPAPLSSVAQPAKKDEKSQNDDPQWAVLEGTVLVGTEPLASQRVQVMYVDEATPITGNTDEKGCYRFDRLHAGEAQVMVGHRDAEGGTRLAERRALLEPGLATQVDFSFLSTGALEGTVRLDGAAPGACLIRAEVAQSSGATESYSAKTDVDGFYRFDAMAAGTAWVRAAVTGPGRVSRVREGSTVIKEGGVARLNLDIDSSKGSRIAGSVLGLSTGEQAGIYALPGAVEAPDSMSFVRFNAIRNKTLGEAAVASPGGDFEIGGLPEGTYTITAVAMAGDGINDLLNGRVASGVVTVAEGREGRIDFDLGGATLQRPALSGTVAGVDPEEHAGLLVLDGTVEVPRPLTLDSLRTLMERPAAVAEFADDGTFEVGRLAPGTYTLVAIAGNPRDGAPGAVGTTTVEIAEGAPATAEITFEENAVAAEQAP